jgi:2-polyprenyl-3-methyl-5-hydroxy-6-metoxy-1,4-benzoquinol methylase
LLDPVAAYNRIAASYAQLSEQRRAYLDAVERLVVAAIPAGSRSLLDVGSGDGVRALRIAHAAGLTNVTLLEPSAAMRRSWPADVTTWAMRAEDLASQSGQFDVITCLWNVFGHIFPAAARAEVLRQCSRLLAPGGRIFVDVSHRYNVAHYGVAQTLWRWFRGSSGDVTVNWSAQGITTMGHVFSAAEFAALCRSAGLSIERRYVLDYATGELRRSIFQGHLLYVLSS